MKALFKQLSSNRDDHIAALPLIVFDVNETLLDLQTMEPIFERIFGERQAMRLWFANLIMYSTALTVAGCYVQFTDIGAAVMKMLADTRLVGNDLNDVADQLIARHKARG
jgi:2-haloacid dehalogenase